MSLASTFTSRGFPGNSVDTHTSLLSAIFVPVVIQYKEHNITKSLGAPENTFLIAQHTLEIIPSDAINLH